MKENHPRKLSVTQYQNMSCGLEEEIILMNIILTDFGGYFVQLSKAI